MFVLSKRSLSRLEGVDEKLVKIVKEAIKITTVDFGVNEGLRTKERQQELFRLKKTRTLKSKHLIGEAVDLIAYVSFKPSFEQAHYYKIAQAMQKAAREQNTFIIWGGVWDKPLNVLSDDLEQEVKAYWKRFKRNNPTRNAFFDGLHFELTAVNH